MKEELLTYKGFLNNEYCFLNNENKQLKFKKTRADLIEEFLLQGVENMNKEFTAKYFVDYSSEPTTYILSDLTKK